jgi:membrane protein YdbS with pleckstrin-like domain
VPSVVSTLIGRPAAKARKVRAMMHLVRHPLSAILLVLVVLFFVFFVLSPLLHVIFDVLVVLAIIWVVMKLVSFHRRYRTSGAKR